MHDAGTHATSSTLAPGDRDEHWLAHAVDALGEGWAVVDEAGRVNAVAGALFAILDSPRLHVHAGARLREIVRALRSDMPLAWPPRKDAGGWHWTARRQDARYIQMEAYALKPDAGTEAGWLLRVRWAGPEVYPTRQSGAAGTLYHPATRLPQQPLLVDRLQQAVERSQRTVTQRFAVVLVNLAALETLEHALLHAIGRQLEEAVRPADTVAHLDHDTLAIIMEPVRGDDTTAQVAIESVIENLRRALDDLPGEGALGASVDFSVAIGDGGSHPSDLIALARSRLARRTVSRGNVLASNEAHAPAPQADCGSEAIVPEPEVDLKSGHRTAIVLHVPALPNADAVIAALPGDQPEGASAPRGTGASHLVIAIDQLPPIDALPRLVHLVRAWREDASLTLELDEAAVARDPEGAIQLIDAATRREVAVGIGRFGIGQCTDSLIARLPLSRLALDPALVAEARHAVEARIRLAATVAWAHERGLTVVATGVADTAMAKLLANLGCDAARGVVFAEVGNRSA